MHTEAHSPDVGFDNGNKKPSLCLAKFMKTKVMPLDMGAAGELRYLILISNSNFK